MLVKMNWESFRKMLRGADAEIREAQKRLAFADGNHPSIQLLIELLDQKSRLKSSTTVLRLERCTLQQ